MTDTDEAARAAIVRTANALADAARAETLAHFRAGRLIPDNKDTAGFDPVTVADRAAEARMREILAAERPEDAILGEEYGASPGTSGLTWVLDPIDGTRAYMSGTPTWGVLIAVGDKAGPLFGVIDQPYIGERFWGGFGAAGMEGPHGPRPLAVSGCETLAEATLFTTYPDLGSVAETTAFNALAREVRLTRYGIDCYAYAMLALGQIDLVVEAGLKPYDIQAPMAVIRAAGGVVTDWQGGPAQEGGRVIAAATPALHARALALLSGAG